MVINRILRSENIKDRLGTAPRARCRGATVGISRNDQRKVHVRWRLSMDEFNAAEASLLSRRWDWLRSGSTKLIQKSDQKRNSPYLISIRCFPNQPRMGRPLQ